MRDITFHVRSWSGWTYGLPEPERRAPPSLRRRITPLGQTALGLAWQMPGNAKARYIFSSRHGEFDRTLSLLKASVQGDDLSPADFTLSVHHALVGLLSIAQNNKNGHTAVAAGEESFCFGLLEAAACVADRPDEPVVFIHCDDCLPAPYDAFAEPGDSPLALVLLLTSQSKETDSISQSWRDQADGQAENHALHFMNFMSGNEPIRQSQGCGRRWQWARHAAA